MTATPTLVKMELNVWITSTPILATALLGLLVKTAHKTLTTVTPTHVRMELRV
jgi:hypothetical protein